MSTCGIDFGTSNSAVALPSGEVLRIDPEADAPRLFRTVLFFPEETKEQLAGQQAIARYLEDNAGRFIQSLKTWLPKSSFTRTHVQGRAMTLEDLIALFLRKLRVQASSHCKTELTDVVLGRPAQFSADPAVDAFAEGRLRTAAGLAGFESVRFVIEPIAAALSYEATLTREEVVLVADFGAGTSDLTIMKLGPGRREKPDRRDDVIASAGVYVGGDRFDGAIMKRKLLRFFGQASTYEIGFKRMPVPSHVMNKLLSWHEMSLIREKSTSELIDHMLKTSDDKDAIKALHDLVMYNLGYRLFRAIEKAKVELSTNEAATIDFDDERVHVHEPITRAEFEAASAHLIDELDACTKGLLERVPAGVKIDSVFLTGGSSQIPSVQRLFSATFGAERIRTADAFTSVAEGLGRAASSSFSSAEAGSSPPLGSDG